MRKAVVKTQFYLIRKSSKVRDGDKGNLKLVIWKAFFLVVEAMGLLIENSESNQLQLHIHSSAD